MVKKNVHGGLKVLLSLLFIILLGTCSTCYASDENPNDPNNFLVADMTINDLKAIFSYIANDDNVPFSSNLKNSLENISDSNLTSTLSYIKQYIPTGTCIQQLNAILYLHQSQDIAGVRFFANNNTIGNSLYHIKIGEYTVAEEVSQIDDNYNVITSNITYPFIRFDKNGGSFYTGALRVTSVENYSFNRAIPINNSDTLLFIPYVYGFRPTGSQPQAGYNTFYFKRDNYNDYSWIWNTNTIELPSFEWSIIPVDPEQPSGDSSGDISINPSGDNGNSGFIDYTNQLNNIKDTISGEGQAIRDTISGESEKIINSITNTQTDFDVSGEMGNIISATNRVVDPTTNFFSWLLDNLRTILNSTGNYDLEISLFGETYIIRSDFFVLPDGDLKDFLQMAFIAWFAWDIIKKIRYIVYAIKCVNISSALNQVDFNPNIL